MVAFAARFNPRISELRHWVALCSMQDVVIDGDTMELSRKEVVWTWAWIQGQQPYPSTVTPYGYAALEQLGFNRNTHKVMVRAGLDLDYTTAAWVYEKRLTSAPRWYKVNGFFEHEGWVFLYVHLQERSDQAQPPVGALRPTQSKVSL
jgi:hypothetical protein